MDGSTLRRDFVLGLLFFGAIALLIYYTISLTGFTFEEKPLVTVFFEQANGLKEGDSVLVSGRPTGTVRQVDLVVGRPDDRRIQVVLEMEQEVALHRPYRIRISEFTLLGGRVVEIDPGPAAGPRVAAGDELLGEVGPSALEALGELVGDNRENVSRFFDNLAKASDELVEGKGLLGGLIYDEQLRTDLEEFVAEARNIAGDIKEGRGTLGMLIEDEEVRGNIVSLINDGAAAAKDFREIVEDMRVGRGTIGALLTDPEMAADARELVTNLSQTSSQLRQMIEQADDGRGLLGRIIADETLAEDATRFVADLAEAGRKLRQGEGSLGQLIADDEAYRELLAALQSLNAQLEDAREAQPISSFASLLFGAF